MKEEEQKIDEFLKQVDAKFAGQTPNGLDDDDPRRLTVGFRLVTSNVGVGLFIKRLFIKRTVHQNLKTVHQILLIVKIKKFYI